MATFTIQEAQAQLADLIHRLTPGEEVVITENNQPVAKLGQEVKAIYHSNFPVVKFSCRIPRDDFDRKI
ncbi:MAG TPA: type II toxin-antitoxin system prevent-host-death family antitoxin [Pirellulaceae bacterium]|nr:type II toxin-antitoxin system prevent-host-death family antitoxin [Pirellulaceae bacterium]